MVWWIDGILPEGTGKWLAPPGFYPTGQWSMDINKLLTTYSAGSSRSGLNSEAGTSSQMWRIDWINMNRSPWNIYRIYSLQMSTVVRNHYDCDPMISQIFQHFTSSGWPDGQGGSKPRDWSELPKRNSQVSSCRNETCHCRNSQVSWLVVTGTCFMTFHKKLGMESSSQLTFTPSFFRGVGEKPPTRFHGTCWENCVLYDLIGFHPSW